MPSPLASLRRLGSTVLDRSRGFFEHRPAARSLPVALVVVAIVIVAVVFGIYGLGVIFDATIDETVTVDNPNQPPEWVCETHDEDSPLGNSCDEPDRIDVDAGSEIRDATTGFLHYAPVGGVVLWLIFGVVLHIGARLADGEGSVGDTFVVAAWALLPEVFRMVAGLAVIHYALAGAEVRDDSMEALGTDIIAALETTGEPLLLASAITIALQWWIVIGGLEVLHDLSRRKAIAVATVFAVLGLLLTFA
ncbi:hypothetical protein JCM17823_12180 [Halorubrum gandharaense]